MTLEATTMEISTFQSEIEAAEQAGNFHEAMQICLNAMQGLESVLRNPQLQISPYQRLELNFSFQMAIGRSQFLLGLINLEAERLLKESREGNNVSAAIEAADEEPSTKEIEQNSSVVADAVSSKIDISAKSENPELQRPSPSTITDPPVSLQTTRHASDEMTELRRRVLSLIDIERPNVTFESIIGMETAKDAILEAVMLPVDYPGTAQAANTWSGILLFGIRYSYTKKS